MSWSAGIIEAATPKGRREVVAWVHGCFALDFRAIWLEEDMTPDGSCGWTVTHQPTGHALFTLLMSLKDAQAIVEEVEQWVDWSSVDLGNSIFLTKRVSKLRERLGERMLHTNATIPPWAVTEFPDGGGTPRLKIVP